MKQSKQIKPTDHPKRPNFKSNSHNIRVYLVNCKFCCKLTPTSFELEAAHLIGNVGSIWETLAVGDVLSTDSLGVREQSTLDE